MTSFSTIPYTLTRSRRKTIAIYITEDATVEVRAPLIASQADIDKFVASKEKWIRTHLAERKRLGDEKTSFTLEYNDMVLFRGAKYPLVAKPGNLAGFDGESFYLPPGLAAYEVKGIIIQVYKMMARKLFKEKAGSFAKSMKVVPSAIKVTSAKTRWGSCSGKNSLNFSWRLVMADDDVIDYVVVHELAHIKEHNHSARFWSIVKSVLPDYQARQRKLKQLQKTLAAQDWD